jgi:hypothetical protein
MLEERMAEYEANPDEGYTWEEVVAYVKRDKSSRSRGAATDCSQGWSEALRAEPLVVDASFNSLEPRSGDRA